MSKKILVIGATGTVGGEVVKSLQSLGLSIRVGIRQQKWFDIKYAQSVEAVYFDYQNPVSVASALSDIDTLFMVSPTGLGQEVAHVQTVLAAAKASRLKHIVRLSAMGVEKHNLFGLHKAADDLLLQSDIDCTILRPNTFMQNFYNYSKSIKLQQMIIEPAGKGKTSFIDVRDIGAVAPTIILKGGYENKVLELTGDKALSYYEVAEYFSDILGAQIQYLPYAESTYIKYKIAGGSTIESAIRAVEFNKMVKAGEYEYVSDNIRHLLDREPVTLKQFIVDFRDYFVT